MPTKKLVVDSCIFIKLFLDEGDQEKAVKFFKKIISNSIEVYVPEIFIYEIFNVCSLKKLDSQKILSVLNHHRKLYLQTVALEDSLVLAAAKITENGHYKSGYPSFYDCSYHALALKEKCTFVTSDAKHFAKTKNLGCIKLFEKINPELDFFE